MSDTKRHKEEYEYYEALRVWREGGCVGRKPVAPVWMRRLVKRSDNSWFMSSLNNKRKKAKSLKDYE